MELLNDLLGLDLKDLEWYHMVIRAILMFCLALLFIRVAGMRAFGSRTPFDVVITITIGAILSRGISGHYPLLPLICAAFTLAVVHRFTAFLTWKFKAFRKLTEGEPVLLYREGKFETRNLAKHSITDEDLERTLREQGLSDWGKVESVWYEISGKISIVQK
jgi:uncharacterized membrane protein YcaP (DUF421 family)